MQHKKWIAAVMSAILMFSALPSAAFSKDDTGTGSYTAKDEVIYGNLDLNGSIEEMYVVNTFHVSEPGELIDFGNYTEVRNLTNLTDMEHSGDKITFEAEEGEFYYQGEMENTVLPWNLSITYLLDGEEMNPEELAGADGELEIQIETTANENIDETFFEHYLLQISLTFDPEVFTDILAPEGTKASSGQDQQVSFSVLPGQEEVFIVSADVTEMEMDPIQINAVPANMSVDTPDLSNVTGEMETLTDAIQEVSQGVSELTEGVKELDNGTGELREGSSAFYEGVNELSHSSGELIDGSASIRDALDQISDSVQGEIDTPDFTELEQLPEGLRDFANGLRESTGSLSAMTEGFSSMLTELDQALEAIPDEEITLPSLDDLSEEQAGLLQESGIDTDTISHLIESHQAAQQFKSSYAVLKEEMYTELEKMDDPAAPIEELAGTLETVATEIENGLSQADQLEGLTQLQEGLSTLSSEYSTFHDGLAAYTEGVDTLSSSYNELNNGLHSLSDGTAELRNGVVQLEEGTNELASETSDLPNQMEEEVEERLEEFDFSDFEPISFVSKENEDVDIVQFVLQTEPIEIEQVEETDEREEEEKGFWDKFLDLFR